MNTIDIRKVIDENGLSFDDIALHMFPTNVHPRLALNRVIRGEAFLDERQISKLAKLSGLSISELFGEVEWKAMSKKGTLLFMSKDFKAELDTETWVTKIFHKDSFFHEEVIHSGFVPLSEYIAKLNALIHNHFNKK